MEHINKVQKETTEYLEKLEANDKESQINFQITTNQLVEIPAGFELGGLILKSQDGSKILKMFD